MELDLIYINESKRIRKEYLTNLTKIIEKEDDIKKYLKIIEDIKDNILDIDSDDEKIYKIKLTEINKSINDIRKNIEPFYKQIKKLDKDQSKLYESIKDKYNGITDDEIKNQVVPYIIEIDKNFIKKNKKIYDKITKK